MLSKSLMKVPKRSTLIPSRLFATIHHNKLDVPNGLQPVPQHPDGHHHHDHPNKTAGADETFVPAYDRKTVALRGLPSAAPASYHLDNPYAHLNGLPLYQ